MTMPGQIDDGPLLWGFPLRGLLPAPVPGRYALLPVEEQAWRGRAAIAFSLMGFATATAWSFALSADPGWMVHLRDELPLLVDDHDLALDVIRGRIAESARRDLERAAAERCP